MDDHDDLDDEGELPRWLRQEIENVTDYSHPASHQYEDEIEAGSGLSNIHDLMSAQSWQSLRQFLVYPIYELMDYEGKPADVPGFKDAVQAATRLASALKDRASALQRRLEQIEQDLSRVRAGLVVACVAVATFALIALTAFTGTETVIYPDSQDIRVIDYSFWGLSSQEWDFRYFEECDDPGDAGCWKYRVPGGEWFVYSYFDY